MPLIGQVFEPFVEYDIALPTRVQLRYLRAHQSPQLSRAVVAAQAHRLGQLAVEAGEELLNPRPSTCGQFGYLLVAHRARHRMTHHPARCIAKCVRSG